MCSVNAADEEQRWVPTHVQVLVIRARALRAKGKHGTSDAYTVIQLGKEKYSTCVMEKSTEPEWGEECSFELQPGVLEEGGRDAYSPGSCDLTLTVMHRALIGLDVFLGQAVIPLDKAFQQRICMKNEWYKLHSKTGKKEKERGELQITVQFTRHNLTASMYDLSIKDKPRSAFGKLRERMRAKKRSADEESSSAIVPGGYGALARMRGRLPSDGGGEEDYEDDEGGELRRSKMRSFFLRGRLRKSSDTRSSTSLGSESSESSSRGGSLSPTAGISVVVSDLSNSPSNSSNLTADNSPDHTVAPSPQVSPVRQMFDNELCDISIPVPHSLTNDNDTRILLPSVCVNGNPVETSPLTHQPPSLILQQPKPQSQPDPTKAPPQKSSPEKTKLTQAQIAKLPEPRPQPRTEPQSQLPKVESKSRPDHQLPALGLLQKGSALSLSLQNISRRGEERPGGGPIDGRRWSFDKPGEEEKAAIAAALEHTGLVSDEVETTVSETEVQTKKKRGLFSHGRGGESAGKGSGTGKEDTGHGQPPTEGKHRGWFSSKDSKPSSAPYQHEAPTSSPRNLTPFPALVKDGNEQPVDGESDTGTSSNKTDISDDHRKNLTFSQSEKHSDWDIFISDRLKPLKIEAQINNFPPPLIEPPGPKVPFVEDGLTVSNIYNTVEAPASDFDSSLPQNSSIEFPELNALACPYPALPSYSVNQDKAIAVSDTEHFVEQSQISSLCSKSSGVLSAPFITPEVSANDCKSLGPLVITVDMKANQETVNSHSSQMLTDDYTDKSVETLTTLVPCCKHFSSDDTSITLGSSDKNLDLQLPKTSQTGMSSYRLDDNSRTDDGDVELKESIRTHLDDSLLAHAATDLLDLSVPSGTTDSVLKTRAMTEEKNAAGELEYTASDRSEVSLIGEGSLIDNLEVVVTSSPGVFSNVPLIKEEICDWQPDPSRGNFKVDVFSGRLGRHLEAEILCGGRQTLSLGCLHPPGANMSMEAEPAALNLNAALSPVSLHLHSLYTSADSEHYLTCGSQHNFISELSQEPQPKHDPFQEAKPRCVSSQVVLPKTDLSLRSVPETQCEQKRPKLFEEPKSVEEVSQSDALNPSVFHAVVPKSDPLKNIIGKCDTSEEAKLGTSTNEAIQQCYPSVDVMLNHDLLQEETQSNVETTQKRTVSPDEELCKVDPQTCLLENKSYTCALQDQKVIQDFCQPAENTCNSDFPSEPTSSITQDLVKTDLLLENIFVNQDTATHTANMNPQLTDVALCPDRTEASNTSQNTRAVSVNVPNVKHFLDNWPSTAEPLTEPSTLPSGRDVNSNFSLSLLDLSPLASSTPHVAVSTNAFPLVTFPITPFTPASSSPGIMLAAPPLPSKQPVSHDNFPQETHQVPTHLSSPHPVKPLTPPDEKKSEGRSVLEKLKSTIHPGRGHHADQDSERKPLVEGGGSYYHLNHSELVSLLVQRDAALRQEREEYERRGVLLEKREVEIKKMKVLIRDLEDYIDTLLVRIMEQTPTLLQVRSKMK
ncbi:hypothetical protein NFI96_034643 [Prochilodus magdalenae]|nr:hypothetical protein NFI96_034643 [Prochilodus magdalenae]